MAVFSRAKYNAQVTRAHQHQSDDSARSWRCLLAERFTLQIFKAENELHKRPLFTRCTVKRQTRAEITKIHMSNVVLVLPFEEVQPHLPSQRSPQV